MSLKVEAYNLPPLNMLKALEEPRNGKTNIYNWGRSSQLERDPMKIILLWLNKSDGAELPCE